MSTLLVDRFQQGQPVVESRVDDSFLQRQMRDFELPVVLIRSDSVVQVKQVAGKRSGVIVIGVRLVRALDQPRFVLRAQQSRELTGIHAGVGVIQLLRQDGAGRHDAATLCRVARDGRDAGQIDRLRFAAAEGRRHSRLAGQHHVRALVVSVFAMGERPHERPQVAPLSQHRQMLADVDAGRVCGDGMELALVLGGPVRLHIERVVLRWSSSQEEVDHGFRRRQRITLAGRFGLIPPRLDLERRQSHQAERSRLNRVPSRDGIRRCGRLQDRHGIPRDRMHKRLQVMISRTRNTLHAGRPRQFATNCMMRAAVPWLLVPSVSRSVSVCSPGDRSVANRTVRG